jgi:formyl-CoA transferase
LTENAKPLAGVKVVEFGTLIAGPFCSRILAEFGAEVIKIEAPGEGDPLRKWRKLYPTGDGETSLWWFVQARNKQSVTSTSSIRKALPSRTSWWRRPISWSRISGPA